MKKAEAIFASAACIIACLGDFITDFIFGSYYTGYDRISQPMSTLGTANSPVATSMTIWWIIMGLLFIIFGLRLRIPTASYPNVPMRIASWLIIIYGFGEGFGTALFPWNSHSNGICITSFIHNFLGGIGILALIILPFILIKVFTQKEHPRMFYFQWFVIVSGILSMLLFNLSKLICAGNFLELHLGLWQRLFLIIHYTNLIIISIMMIYATISNNKNPS